LPLFSGSTNPNDNTPSSRPSATEPQRKEENVPIALLSAHGIGHRHGLRNRMR
jgi:hypothetical protein